MKRVTAPDRNILVRLADWSVVARGVQLVARALRETSLEPGTPTTLFTARSNDLELALDQLARSWRDWSTDLVIWASGGQRKQRFASFTRGSPGHTKRAREQKRASEDVISSPAAFSQSDQRALSSASTRATDSSARNALFQDPEVGTTPTGPMNPPSAHVSNVLEDASPQEQGRSGARKVAVKEHAPTEASIRNVHSEPHRVDESTEQASNPGERPQTATVINSNIHSQRTLGEARRVPATTFERMLGFGNLALGIAWNATKNSLWGHSSSEEASGLERYLSPENADRIARTLCRMRGAALKLGQMLSMQDERTVPPMLLQALERARQGADFMPRRQLERVLRREWGADWPKRVLKFDFEPVAAASIGQVHRAKVLWQDCATLVAVKVQYPGVAASIESDLKNLKRLLTYTNLIPRGLYLDEAIRVAREELLRECDYVLEAANQTRFAAKFQGFDHGHVNIPRVLPTLSTRNILTTEWVEGVPLDRVVQLPVSAARRDALASRILRLTLHELFVERFMQTDPNFSNFLYEMEKDRLHLLDFGAARSYPKPFVDAYLRLVKACADRDRASILEYSRQLGFLTGEESKIMLDAHCEAAFVVGEPFASRHADGYDFAASNIAVRAARFGQVMLQHRLCPPPREAYSLHRRLSGAFLTCMRLQANIPCRVLLEEVYLDHDWGPEPDPPNVSNAPPPNASPLLHMSSTSDP